MSTTSQQVENRIKRDDSIALGLPGILQIAGRYTLRGGDNYSSLGKLTDQELVTVNNCAKNEENALLSGLKTLGDLVSSCDTEKAELDHNGVGWLVKTMAESLDSLSDMRFAATDELARRGYNYFGVAVTKSKASTAEAKP